MVSDMKQIRDLAADRDQEAQQLADLETAAQVIVDIVVKPPSGSAASSPTLLGITWLMP